jgi:hypothetical protein
MTQPSKINARSVVENIIGWAGGLALSQYAGSSLWIPGGATLVVLVVFSKTSFKPPYFQGAIAVLSGHLAWLLVGAVVAGAGAVIIVELLLVAAALAWLWSRPGVAPAAVLCTYEIFCLTTNVRQMLTVTLGSDDHKALTVHCVFRLLALGSLVVGYLHFSKVEIVDNSAAGG